MNPWFIILTLYIILILTLGFLSFCDDNFEDFCTTPKEIYNTTNLNIVACFILWLLDFAVNPIPMIIHFISFLCHVGRKHKEDDEWYGL